MGPAESAPKPCAAPEVESVDPTVVGQAVGKQIENMLPQIIRE